MISFNENGAWCWFEDERAIVDVGAQRLLVASNEDSSGIGGAARNFDPNVMWSTDHGSTWSGGG